MPDTEAPLSAAASAESAKQRALRFEDRRRIERAHQRIDGTKHLYNLWAFRTGSLVPFERIADAHRTAWFELYDYMQDRIREGNEEDTLS